MGTEELELQFTHQDDPFDPIAILLCSLVQLVDEFTQSFEIDDDRPVCRPSVGVKTRLVAESVLELAGDQDTSSVRILGRNE